MATFIGFNTINQNKKFTLTDVNLVKRDFLNSLSIAQGEIPGRPDYGSRIWEYIFDSQSRETNRNIVSEVQRIADLDPRIFIRQATVYNEEHGVRIELQVQILPSSPNELLVLFFDTEAREIRFV